MIIQILQILQLLLNSNNIVEVSVLAFRPLLQYAEKCEVTVA